MDIQKSNDINRKEEILERSRKSKQDEGIDYIKKEGTSIGTLVATFLICVLSAISALAGRMETVWALGAVSSAFWFGEVFANYRFTKNKSYMVKTIIAALTVLAFVYWFMASVQGW